MTEIKTFKLERTFKDIDDLYEFLMQNIEFIGEYCGIRIEKTLKEKPFCITGNEKETGKNIIFYSTKETMTENIGELVFLAAAFRAEIVVFLVSKINVVLLEPINWLHNICNDNTQFILGEVNFKDPSKLLYKL